MKIHCHRFVAVLLLLGVAVIGGQIMRADEPVVPEETSPFTPIEPVAPSAPRIAELIQQLDANRFGQRQQASQQLLEAGALAIPALTEAAQGDRRETTDRALDILKKHLHHADAATKAAAREALEKITRGASPAAARRAQEILHPKPVPPPAPPGVPLGGLPPGPPQFKRVNFQNINGVKTVTVEENFRKLKIHDDPQAGITVDVTETKDGKEQTKKYAAKNLDELEQNHPEAFQLYNEHLKKAALPAFPGFLRPPFPELRLERRFPPLPLPPTKEIAPPTPGGAG